MSKMSVASSMVNLQRNGLDPFNEHKRVKRSVRFPLNPAFFKTSLQDRQILQSMNAYCRTLKVPLNKKQNVEYMTERANQQYDHFKVEIERIIKGHRDQEFEDGLVAFITSVNLADMTEAEKELVFSKTMSGTLEGRLIRDIIKDYLDSTMGGLSPAAQRRAFRKNTLQR